MNVIICSLACSMLVSLFATDVQAQSLQISGGVDARLTNEHENASEANSDVRPRLEGAFLNLRKVWTDDLGDRWIGVAQADFDDNLRSIRPYQLYMQYKGPLGKWNVRAGHYLLPFGLLATHDTERLVLQGQERTSLGIRKDTGVEALGRFGDWDYAASVSDGLSDVRFADSRANPLFTGRLAHVQGDTQVGISVLDGRVLLDPTFGIGSGAVRERRVGLDTTQSFGPLTVRAEAVGGTNDAKTMFGGLFLGDYALSPKLELNIRYAYSDLTEQRGHQTGLGLTYQLRPGLFVRVADAYQFNRENKNAFTLQLYYEFSKPL